MGEAIGLKSGEKLLGVEDRSRAVRRNKSSRSAGKTAASAKRCQTDEGEAEVPSAAPPNSPEPRRKSRYRKPVRGEEGLQYYVGLNPSVLTFTAGPWKSGEILKAPARGHEDWGTTKK